MRGSMVDIQSGAAEIRRGKKKETGQKYMSASAMQCGHNKQTDRQTNRQQQQRKHVEELNACWNGVFFEKFLDAVVFNQ